MRRLLGAVLLVLAGLSAGGTALADARVAICFNYGCLAEAEVVFTEAQLSEVAETLGNQQISNRQACEFPLLQTLFCLKKVLVKNKGLRTKI